MVLFAEACGEGGRADAAFERLCQYVVRSWVSETTRTCSADDEDLHGCNCESVEVIEIAAKARLILL